MKNSKCYEAGRKKRRNYSAASREGSGVALGGARPAALLAGPSLFTLRSVSLCCAGWKAGVALGVPSGVWGWRTRRGAVLGRSVRTQEV